MIKCWTAKIAAIGASAVLTMRIFSEPPRGRLRASHVIERVIDEAGGVAFDPREIVGNQVVITLPIDRNAAPRRQKTHFRLN